MKRSIGEVVVPKVEQVTPAPEERITYIEISSITTAKDISGARSMLGASAPTRARQRVQTGDVLVSMTRPNLNGVAIVPDRLDGSIASTGFDVLRSAGLVAPRWLYYRVQTQAFIDDMCDVIQGVVYPAVRPFDVRGHKMPVPPLPEQHRIVAAIETHFSRLDAAVASLTRAKANVKRARASVLRAAVEGRLVPTDAALARIEGCTYEPASALLARILAERKAAWAASGARGKYKEPVAPDTGGLPGLAEGWGWASVEQVTTDGFTNGLYVPKSAYGDGVPILRIDDFQDDWSRGRTDLRRVRIDAATAEQYAIRPGQLVVNRVNSMTHLGKSLAIEERHSPAVFESNMMRATIHPACQIRFLTAWLRSRSGREMLLRDAKWAVNQASINQGDVGRTPLPLPPSPNNTASSPR